MKSEAEEWMVRRHLFGGTCGASLCALSGWAEKFGDSLLLLHAINDPSDEMLEC